jgi:hypothetical protein
MPVVKFSTLAGGVFIEQDGRPNYEPDTRCFRFDKQGNAEWASYGSLTDDPERARWFGHVLKERDFLFA